MSLSYTQEGAVNILDVSRVTIAGFPAIRARNRLLSFIIVPDLGGKLCSLRDLRSNREWLWRHPRLPYRRNSSSTDYLTQADTGGWDEFFPTITPCRLHDGTALPDHGELWSQTPVLEVLPRRDSVALRCRWRGNALDYTFERTLFLNDSDSRVRLEYTLTNTTDGDLSYIWHAQPQFVIEPGMRLEVPHTVAYKQSASPHHQLVAVDHGLSDSHDNDLPDLLRYPLPPPNGTLLHLRSDPLPQHEQKASLHAHNGSMHIRWDAGLLPQLGIHLNLGAWAGDAGSPLYNLGMGPGIGAAESLADAITRQVAASLGPRATRRWWLELDFEAS